MGLTRERSPAPRWIDAHNHVQDARLQAAEDPARTVAAMRAQGIARWVVNATSEADWEAVGSLARQYPDEALPAYGIHPWNAHTAAEGWQQRLRRRLQDHPQASIGECGLDRWISHPPLEVQLPLFLDHLRLANELDRPVTIHCLKAWGPLLEAFEEVPPPRRWLLHSFGGSREIATRLIALGASVSFSGYFLQPRKQAVLEVFRQLPRERILLETDAPDMLPPANFRLDPLAGGGPSHTELNHPANLPAIGRGLAQALGMAEEELAQLTATNAQRFFGIRGVAGPAPHG